MATRFYPTALARYGWQSFDRVEPGGKCVVLSYTTPPPSTTGGVTYTYTLGSNDAAYFYFVPPENIGSQLTTGWEYSYDIPSAGSSVTHYNSFVCPSSNNLLLGSQPSGNYAQNGAANSGTGIFTETGLTWTFANQNLTFWRGAVVVCTTPTTMSDSTVSLSANDLNTWFGSTDITLSYPAPVVSIDGQTQVNASRYGSVKAAITQTPVLTATVVGSTQIDLSWTSIPNTVYEIRRNGATIVASHAATTYSDAGLLPSTEYTYEVRGKRTTT